jgi:hypothetical protein
MNLIKILQSFILFMIGGFGHWYIMYWQFKAPNWIKSPLPYLLAVLSAWFWIKASEYGVAGFNGSMWSNRFMFFITGVFVGILLYPYHFGQPFTLKVLIQIILAVSILLVSVLMK